MSKLNLKCLAAMVLTAVATSGVLAQSTPPAAGGQPSPAENRSSTGAIELERSPVPAKRDHDAALASQRMGASPAPAANTESRAAARARIRAERAAAAESRRQGAAGQKPN